MLCIGGSERVPAIGEGLINLFCYMQECMYVATYVCTLGVCTYVRM